MKKLLILFLIAGQQLKAQQAFCPNCSQPGTNLVTNGDFSLSNNGFTTNLIYSATGTSNPGSYAVRSQANSFWAGGCSVLDHSPGGGTSMLCVDGKTTGSTIAWEQTVANIQKNKNYFLSFYIRLAVCSQAGLHPTLLVFINASQTGDTICITDGSWRKISYAWNSGNASNAVIQLIDSTQGGNGNDFIIDDIQFSDCTSAIFADAGPDITVCAGNPIQLHGSGSGNGTCNWSGPAYLDNYTSCNPVFSCLYPGNYFYVFDYSTGFCISTDSMWVHVVAAAKPVITQHADSLLCTPSVSYQWYTHAGIIPGATNENYIPQVSGYYFVTVYNAAGCSAISDSVQFIPCNKLITVYAGEDQDVCAGIPFTLQALTNGPGNCIWAGPSGLNNYYSCSPVFMVNSPGDYIYSVMDEWLGCISVDSINMHVNSLPQKPVVTQQGDSLVSSPADFYQWYFTNTLLTADTLNYLIPSQNGFYLVMITDMNGCRSASDSFAPGFTYIESSEFIPGIYVYYNQVLNQLKVSNTGLFEYPITVCVYDINAKRKLVMKKQFLSEPEIIMGRMPNGIYLVEISSKSERFCKKILFMNN